MLPALLLASAAHFHSICNPWICAGFKSSEHTCRWQRALGQPRCSPTMLRPTLGTLRQHAHVTSAPMAPSTGSSTIILHVSPVHMTNLHLTELQGQAAPQLVALARYSLLGAAAASAVAEQWCQSRFTRGYLAI